MNRIHLITALILLLFSFSLRAEDDKVRFAYDVDFEMRFDNREYYRSAFSPSMTIFGARFHFHGSRYSGCQQVVSLKFNLSGRTDFRAR